MPEAVFASALIRWTRMRSRRGARDLIERREVAWQKSKKLSGTHSQRKRQKKIVTIVWGDVVLSSFKSMRRRKTR